jgi:hypothetical protein
LVRTQEANPFLGAIGAFHPMPGKADAKYVLIASPGTTH